MKNKVSKMVIQKNNGITECYVLNKDYVELEEKYKTLLASIEAKKPEKELKLYDIVNYYNHKWYVIKIENDEVTLMSKDVIGTCTYSDNNSNDWKDSNVINKCLELFDEIQSDDLISMKTNYDEDKYSCDLVRIPTLREIEAMPMSVRECGDAYWTMTSSYGVSEDSDYAFVFRVYSSGYLNYDGVDSTNGVRPVIKIRKDSLNE